MTTFEAYLSRYPQVSRLRADRLISDGICYFLKEGKNPIALLPKNGSSDDLVATDPAREVCDCNVFRTKRACPHIAAALGFIEKNGGEVPYTDPVQHVFARLENLKKRGSSYGRYAEMLFLRDVKPFLPLLPAKERPRFMLELGYCYQSAQSQLTEDEYADCCTALVGMYRMEHSMGKLLFQNRKDCMKAIIALMRHSYANPFSEKEKETIVKEIAQNEKLTRKYLPILASSYASYFSREQLLQYYATTDHNNMDPLFLRDLLKRLVEEEPPRYDDFIRICNESPNGGHFHLETSTVEKVVQAGYGESAQVIVDYLVDQINSIEDYHSVISMVSHEAFLASWKSRSKRRYYRWNDQLTDWELEIDFREDPEASPDQYYLESLDCRLLEVILWTRPEYRNEINQAARKKYRQALKMKSRSQALEALVLLMKGEDAIAAKYAAEWDLSKGTREELVYLIAAGLQFDCLPKILPEIRTLEVPHAAG